MTPAERARMIERQEFEAESRAALRRARRYVEQCRAADKALVDRWMTREAPEITLRRSGPIPAKLYTHNGEAKSLTEWASIVGVSYKTLARRVRSGMPFDQAITMRLGQRAQRVSLAPRVSRAPTHTINDDSKTLKQWADAIGIDYSTLIRRMRKGRTLAEAVAMPVGKQGQAQTHTIDGVSKTLKQWADAIGISYNGLHERMRKGRTLAEAVAMPVGRWSALPRSTDSTATPGVSSNLEAFEGTGAGSTAQEIPEITFPEKVENA